MRTARFAAIVLALVAAMTGCTTAGETDSASTPASVAPTATAPPPEPGNGAPGFVEMVQRLSPSVVTVQTEGGLGSAVVLRPDVVVTNAHVVGDGRQVTMIYADGIRSSGAVLATDRVTDLAVIRTTRTDLPVPQFRTELPQPGEPAVAIGSPLGFQGTVSAGVISGLHRDIPGSAPQSPSLVDLIQTDAPISPGNSGGALLDHQGRVVGISEAYIPPELGAVSIGFAIPSATVLDVTAQLLRDGRATHPYLGISIGRVTSAIEDVFGMEIDHGALVLGVDADSPAAASGLRPGDVIVELAGEEVRNMEDLLSALRQTDPGQQHQMAIIRGGERQEVSVTIDSRSG
jgi:serine protease Do